MDEIEQRRRCPDCGRVARVTDAYYCGSRVWEAACGYKTTFADLPPTTAEQTEAVVALREMSRCRGGEAK